MASAAQDAHGNEVICNVALTKAMDFIAQRPLRIMFLGLG